MVMLTFIATIIFGIIAIILAFKARKYRIEETNKVLSLRAYGIMILCIGFSLHTLGDVLALYYGDVIEILLESIAHIIILGSFIIFYMAAQYAIKSSRGY